jgi:hypothetical protein
LGKARALRVGFLRRLTMAAMEFSRWTVAVMRIRQAAVDSRLARRSRMAGLASQRERACLVVLARAAMEAREWSSLRTASRIWASRASEGLKGGSGFGDTVW